eukprot:gene2638-3835_t
MQRKLSSFSFGKSSKPKEGTSSAESSPSYKNLTKNKKFLDAKKSFGSLQKETKFTKETLEKLAKGFYMAHPDGKMLKDEFIRENLEFKGGVKELWSSVFDLMDSDENGYIDINEFLLANSIAATGSIETKVAWMFNLFDEDKSGTLEEDEVKNFVDMLLKTNSNMSDNLQSRKKFVDKLYSILDEEKNGEVTLEDFIRVARSNSQLADLVNTYTQTIRYEIDFHNKKSNNVKIKNFDSQVAGHSGGIKSIIKKGKQIWKPLNQREYEFYEEIKSLNDSKDIIPLKESMVEYYGRTYIDYTDREDIGQIVHYLMIDDLTYNMNKPCIIDLKMGTREYSDHDSKKKQIQKVILSSVTSSNILGFRICGMKVWNLKEKQYGTQSKKKALLLNTQQVEESLITFIDNGKMIRYNIYKIAIEKLNKIKEWFEKQTKYQFYASSILIIYDGDNDSNDNVIIKMIDFAHTQKSKNEKDESYLIGLNNLITRLLDILNEKLKYKKNGKGILIYPEIEKLNNSITSMQNNIDSILLKNQSSNQLNIKMNLKLKEKDEIINKLNIELNLLNQNLNLIKSFNHLKNEKDLLENYETKLLLKDIKIKNLELNIESLNEQLKSVEECSGNVGINDEVGIGIGISDEVRVGVSSDKVGISDEVGIGIRISDDLKNKEIKELKYNLNLKEEIINEKNYLIKSLLEYNQNLKKKNEKLNEMNEKTMIYSSILNLKNEFEDIKSRNELNLKLKDEELKKEKEKWEMELNKLKNELKEKNEEIKKNE